MQSILRLVAALIALTFALPASAQIQGTKARAALVIEVNSGAVLLEKNADESLPPASMSKLMTLELVFGMLKSTTR